MVRVAVHLVHLDNVLSWVMELVIGLQTSHCNLGICGFCASYLEDQHVVES